jgi:hypothetical protein
MTENVASILGEYANMISHPFRVALVVGFDAEAASQDGVVRSSSFKLEVVERLSGSPRFDVIVWSTNPDQLGGLVWQSSLLSLKAPEVLKDDVDAALEAAMKYLQIKLAVKPQQATLNPYNILREKVADIFEFERQLPSEAMEFYAVANESGEFYCTQYAGETRGKRAVFVELKRLPMLTEELVQNRISEDEELDAETYKADQSTNVVDTGIWQNWGHPIP